MVSEHWSPSPFNQTHSPALTCINIVKAPQDRSTEKGGHEVEAIKMRGIKFRHPGILGARRTLKERVSLHPVEA